MATLFTINPSRRKRHGKKRRSAKQRAATRRMLAANRGRFASNPRKYKRRRKSSKSTAVAVVRRARRAGRRAMRAVRRRGARRGVMRLSTGNVMKLLQAGAIGGAGAVLVDIGMGQAQRFLPAAFATPTDASGNVQYGYFGAKAGLALLLGAYGGKVIPSAMAEKMAEGSLTVLAYQFIRPMVPMAMGYFNPAPTMRPSVRGVGAYVAGAGAYAALPVRSNAAVNAKGGRAANVLNMVNVRRTAA